jgi:hypothetical protein
MSPMNQPQPWKSTAALIACILCALSWELTAFKFALRWMLGPAWIGPNGEWTAFSVSVLLSLYHWFFGRQLIKEHYRLGDESKRSLTAVQAAVVIVISVAVGAFIPWVFLLDDP